MKKWLVRLIIAGLAVFVLVSYGGRNILDDIGNFTNDVQSVKSNDIKFSKTTVTNFLNGILEELFPEHDETDTKKPDSDSGAQKQTAFTEDVRHPKGLNHVVLNYVVDGDTLDVTDDNGFDYRVRLLLCNTEESVHKDEEKNNEYGKAASEMMKAYLKDTSDLWLSFDEELYDAYGRLLAYVWTTDSADCDSAEDYTKYTLNAYLISTGYAYVIYYTPNFKFLYETYELEKAARYSETGLWKYEEFKELADARQ